MKPIPHHPLNFLIEPSIPPTNIADLFHNNLPLFSKGGIEKKDTTHNVIGNHIYNIYFCIFVWIALKFNFFVFKKKIVHE